MKRNRVFSIALLTIFAATSSVLAAPVDVQRHWCGTAVNTLMEHGIISQEISRFQPDHHITRSDAALYLFGLAKYNEQHNTETEIEDYDGDSDNSNQAVTKAAFSDLPASHTAAGAVEWLAGRGILSGYPDRTFRPQATLSRQEFALMLDNYQKSRENAATKNVRRQETIQFSDISESFAGQAIQDLCQQGILSGYGDGTFRPQGTITKAEAAAAIYSMSSLPASPPAVALPERNEISVPYISQLSPVSAVVGCEGTSLLMGLKAKGYALNVDLRQFLDAMPKHPTNPAKGFVGSPYRADKTKRTRTTILPPILARYAGQYGKVEDISGSSPKEIQAELLAGNPVVIYATMNWEKPYYRYYNVEGTTQRMLSNNHVVLLCGYDSRTNYYYVADPYNSRNTSKELKYWISADTLEPIYKARAHALVVK